MKTLIIVLLALAACGYGAYAKYCDGESKITIAAERRTRAETENETLGKTVVSREKVLAEARTSNAELKARLAEVSKSAPEKALAEARAVVNKRIEERTAELEAAKARLAAAGVPAEVKADIATAELSAEPLLARIAKCESELPRLLAFKATEEAAVSKAGTDDARARTRRR